MGILIDAHFIIISYMKLMIKFSKNTEVVPFDYIIQLRGLLHDKLLGDRNSFHDCTSLYSISMLNGGNINKNKTGINFNNGAYWYVSSNNNKFLNNFILNTVNYIKTDGNFAFGMKVISIEEVKDYTSINNNGVYKLITKSPVLIEEYVRETKETVFYTYESDDKIVNEKLKNTILTKANKSGFKINSDDFSIGFDKSFENKKIKRFIIKYLRKDHPLIVTASSCPVIVKTTNPDIVKFIKNVGVGASTGCGFGYVE